MVTEVPPAVVPKAGVSAVIVGGGVRLRNKMSAAPTVLVPPAKQTSVDAQSTG